MSDSEYREALKRGQREYRACLSRGEYPYLSVLDEILPPLSQSTERDLGIRQIPMEWIAGTRHKGRADLFARNFMPLAADNTEFAVKWERLCQSHLDEGIREPVKAYEYLNRYYIEEGNKRVSVLRFFDAVTVPAHVFRILPEKKDFPELKRYFELIDFYAISGINCLEFSKSGSCAALLSVLGKTKDQSWTDDDRQKFLAAYYIFKDVYDKMGGKSLSLTVGDAMLAYLKVYGPESLKDKSPQQIQETISRVWEEITLQQEEDPIDIKLDPVEKKPNLITKVLSAAEPRLIKAAFIHDGSPEESSWTRGHEQGRLFVEQALKDQIRTTPYMNALQSDPDAVIHQAIQDGNTVIFTTSPRLLPAALKAAVENQNITVFNCSLNQSHRYIRTYYPRMYEVKFIIGAIAGAMAGDMPVGYLCDYPIFGQIAGINAFALGVQMVNPRAKVLLEWSSVGGVGEAIGRLTERGARLISSQDLVRLGEWRSFGLSLFENGKQINLATPLWQWGAYYQELLRLVKNHSEETDYKETGKALNYYWGLSAGVVDFSCSEDVPASTRKLAGLLKNSIRAGICNPFRGPLYTQNGKVLENDELLTPLQVMEMDFLNGNVVGQIPSYTELNETARATVDQVGVKPATKQEDSQTGEA
ncbi:MAG: BMP family ABC transporter substrate-binding protein [Firmicutes bacterium]|nr:BMP family ABC transporter substrate-binding protein [Bacillota bacterium]